MPQSMQGDPTSVERAVSRTLRDSLERLQRTSAELDQAVADFVAACASNRPANALPSMLRAQTASASLAATLDVLSRFVTSSLQPDHRPLGAPNEQPGVSSVEVEADEDFESSADASESAIEPAEIRDWPAMAEPDAWPEAQESHAAPRRSEISQPEAAQPSSPEHEQVLEPEPGPEDTPFEFEPLRRPELEPVLEPAQRFVAELSAPPITPIVASAPQPAPVPEPVSTPILAHESAQELALEPPSDPALLPTVESALSPEISAMPDALEPLATWSAPPPPEEPTVPEFNASEIAPDGIVEDSELAEATAEATAAEESKIIEEAIAGGIAKLSDRRAAALEVEQAGGLSHGSEFDIALLSENERELHRRASRVAKVSMQDIKLLQPEQVELGRQYKDICVRLRADIERAHKEYGRRFKPILDQPVDYFYDWMVQILAAGDPSALGEYPYPTHALRS